MSNYDEQYKTEQNLFGTPYAEFEAFIERYGAQGGKALDLGCGQGRDALLLARYGYTVTGVDSSAVGVAQMVERAKASNLSVIGVVGDLHEFRTDENFDVVVLDSILHFIKNDRAKEMALLERVLSILNVNGYVFIFVHQSGKNEKELRDWFAQIGSGFEIAEEGCLDYTYEEKATGFKSEFQFFMFVIRRV